MKQNRNQLQLILTAAVSLLLLYLLYRVYNLSEVLIYEEKALDFSDYQSAKSVFYTLTALTAFTVIAVLAVLAYTIRSSKYDVIYLEKNSSIEKDKSNSQQKEESKNQDIKSSKEKINSSEDLLKVVSENIEAAQAILYLKDKKVFSFSAGYALYNSDELIKSFELGEGLTGQVAKEAKALILNDLKERVIKVASGLGEDSAKSLGIFPILNDKGQTTGVLEVAKLSSFKDAEVNWVKDMISNWEATAAKNTVKSSPEKKKTGKTTDTKK